MALRTTTAATTARPTARAMIAEHRPWRAYLDVS